MKISREEKKAEAVRRLKKLKIYKETVRQFEKDGLVSISEPPFGAFYWVDEEEQKMVTEFENKYDCLVYLVVRSFTQFGKLDSMLYVSDHKEEWSMDDEDLDDMIAMTYTVNHDTPEFSEFGSIGLRYTIAGSVLRRF